MARFSMTVPAPVGNKRDLVGGLLLNLVLLAGVLVMLGIQGERWERN